SLIKDLVPSLDMVLIMSVNPGFGGQKFIPYAIEKIKEVKELKDMYNMDMVIQVDGGVDPSNIKSVVDAGADVVVAGSAVFKGGNVSENIKALREAI
ncbi:MAG: ribulose-phosphate 3-epimerase, partial [Clostridium sp.]